MVIRNKLFAATAIGSVLFGLQVSAAEIERNTAQMQAMDKITGRVSVVEVPVNSEVNFGSFSIVVRACKTTPPEETPENYAFVDVADSSFGKMQFNIFKGWMMSSSPALNAVEHPIYDVWLLKCMDTTVDKSKLLTAEQLKERDGLPKLADIKQDATEKTEETSANKPAASPTEVPTALAEEPKDKVLDSYTNPVAAKDETVPAATAPLADAQVPESSAPTTAEPAAENPSGPQSLLNIPDTSVVANAPAETASNRPDIKVDEANIIESSDWVEVPANAPAAKPAEEVAPLSAPETPVVAPTPLLPEPATDAAAPLAPTAEQPVSDNVSTDNSVETLPEDEEDQFIDLSNEADATAALEAELSAEALKD